MAKYDKHPIVTEVYYELAKLYRRQGNKYKPLVGDDYKWHMKKAYDLCMEAVMTFRGSFGAISSWTIMVPLMPMI